LNHLSLIINFEALNLRTINHFQLKSFLIELLFQILLVYFPQKYTFIFFNFAQKIPLNLLALSHILLFISLYYNLLREEHIIIIIFLI
jgi:hypothetical protein